MKSERSAFAVASFCIIIAELAYWQPIGKNPAREGLPACGRTFHDVRDKAAIQCFSRSDRITPHYHLYGKPWPNCAGEALRSAAARQKAQFDLGQAEFGGVGRDAGMAGHCGFQPSPEGMAMDGSDNGLRRVLDDPHKLVPCRGPSTACQIR